MIEQDDQRQRAVIRRLPGRQLARDSLLPRAEKSLAHAGVKGIVPFVPVFISGRAPEGKVAITSFAGGSTDPEIVALPEPQIAAIVYKENAHVLRISGPPLSSSVWRHEKALPQYSLGHGHIVESIRDAERKTPGLFFAANYLEGPSLGKCLDVGTQTADAVQEYLRAS